MNSIIIWLRHQTNRTHVKHKGIWYQIVKEFQPSQKEQAKKFAQELKDKGYEVAGYIGSQPFDFTKKPSIFLSVKALEDGRDIKELKEPELPLKKMLFRKPIGSRIKWGIASLVTFGFAYFFQNISGQGTLTEIGHSFAFVGWFAGSIGLITFSILGIDSSRRGTK